MEPLPVVAQIEVETEEAPRGRPRREDRRDDKREERREERRGERRGRDSGGRDDERVVGMGDHMPEFLTRSFARHSTED